MDDYITFGSPTVGEAEIAEVLDSLKSGWIGTGPKVTQFANAFAGYVNADFAVPVNSCTAALHLSLLDCNIQSQDKVITTPMTFCSTVNTILHVGATPVFVDVQFPSGLIDPNVIEETIDVSTKAIMPVHLWGQVADLDAVNRLATGYNLRVIEDAAHAIESSYKGKKIGSISTYTCFSFYATKNITTVEGGMVTTNDENIAERIKVMALHGLSDDAWKRYSDQGYKHYDVVYPGFKYNMTDIQAALGIHQLNRIDEWHDRREKIWDYYNEAFSDLPVQRPSADTVDHTHSYHLYTLLIDLDRFGMDRDRFMQEMHVRGIGTGVHYRAVHLHEYYRKKFGYSRDDFPNATKISDQTISLPLGPSMTDADVMRVTETVKDVFYGRP